jgi:nitrate reductase cytochrome c-type subunit
MAYADASKASVPRGMRVRIPLPAHVIRRQPLDLQQVDDNSCLTCVTANVLYVLGVTDTPDTQWVDREVGREPGNAAQRVRARRFLFEQGLYL